LKWNTVQSAFCASVLVHAVIFGVVAVTAVERHKPTLEPEGTVTVLTLVAAPEEPEATQVQAGNVKPPVVPPVPVVPEVIRPLETPVPTKPEQPLEPVKLSPPVQREPPAIQATAPAPVAPALPQSVVASVRGDGSSPTPGADATTVEAQPEIKAEPSYLANPLPAYPMLARRRHQEGLVVLSVKVTAAGKADSVRIKDSSGFPLLDAAAVEAVREWEFNPARSGRLAFPSEIEVPVRFTLTP
jgi:protein TonB